MHTVRRSAPLVPALVAAGGYSFVSILRYDRFGAHAFDLGIFDQAIWGYSRFELIDNTVKGTSNLLGDHFSPILALAAPLYWVWADPRALLVLQALLLAASSLPLFFFARRRLPTTSSFLIQIAYLGFVGVWSAAVFDFHEVAFAAPLVALALWALDLRRLWLFVACCVAGAFVKEDVVVLFAAFAAYAAVKDRRGRELEIALAALLVLWFALETRVVLPHLGGHAYGYASAGRIFDGGKTKLVTLIALLGSWLFLPLRSPLCLLAILPLAERMLNTNANYWTLHFHYSLTVAPILAFAAADGLARLQLPRLDQALAALALATSLVVSAAVLPRSTLLPLSADAAAATGRCVDMIPADASVVATSALVPHLSRRRTIYTFASRPATARPEFLAVNAAAPSGPLGKRGVARIVRRALRRGYRIACRGGGTLVLRERATSAGSR